MESHFMELFVLKCHNEESHSGLEYTFNRIRCKYWLMNGKATVKGIIKKCATCRLIQAKCVQPLLPPIPLVREHRVCVISHFSMSGLIRYSPR